MSQGLSRAGSGLEAPFPEAPAAAAGLPSWGFRDGKRGGNGIVPKMRSLKAKSASQRRLQPALEGLGGKLSLVEGLGGGFGVSRGQSPPWGCAALGEGA